MTKRIGYVSVWLKYDIPENEDPKEYLANVELPKEYVEDTFEFVKVEERED